MTQIAQQMTSGNMNHLSLSGALPRQHHFHQSLSAQGIVGSMGALTGPGNTGMAAAFGSGFAPFNMGAINVNGSSTVGAHLNSLQNIGGRIVTGTPDENASNQIGSINYHLNHSNSVLGLSGTLNPSVYHSSIMGGCNSPLGRNSPTPPLQGSAHCGYSEMEEVWKGSSIAALRRKAIEHSVNLSNCYR